MRITFLEGLGAWVVGMLLGIMIWALDDFSPSTLLAMTVACTVLIPLGIWLENRP